MNSRRECANDQNKHLIIAFDLRFFGWSSRLAGSSLAFGDRSQFHFPIVLSSLSSAGFKSSDFTANEHSRGFSLLKDALTNWMTDSILEHLRRNAHRNRRSLSVCSAATNRHRPSELTGLSGSFAGKLGDFVEQKVIEIDSQERRSSDLKSGF